jgi:hypothetical protein
MKHTVESYLQHLVSTATLDSGDTAILNSIARQLTRGKALTDRQYELVKSKLINYRDHFESNGMHSLDLALETLAFPLRSVDRSQTVTVEDGWLVVKFPFNKKTISHLNLVSAKFKQFYSHTKGSNEHKFKLYEPVINEIVELFKNKNFTIDPKLLELNDEIQTIKDQKLEFVPHITEQGIINVNENVLKTIETELGDFNNNAIKYWDRSIRYGYEKSHKLFDSSKLAEHIANRTTAKVYLSPELYSIDAVAEAIRELYRFPLLITLTRNKEYEEIKTLFERFDFVDPQQQILLNRVDDSKNDNYAINSFIKDKKFNTWLDKDIKIAYIFKDNLPKILIKGDWQPTASLSLSGEREQTNVGYYIYEHCDLHIIRDNQTSYWENTISRQLTQWV